MSENKKLTTKEQIEETLQEVRQYIQNDGGDVLLESFENGILTLLVTGHCVGCGSFDMTFTMSLKPLLMEKFPEIKEVIFKTPKSVWDNLKK